MDIKILSIGNSTQLCKVRSFCTNNKQSTNHVASILVLPSGERVTRNEG